jgi:uncharacterized RDD family membrane protein YckC
LSTSLNHLPEPAWKKEVNQRIAAHMKGKSAPAQPEAAEQAAPAEGNRAAKAAARVAKRFAKAPSYSQMLAAEARAAVDAAEAVAAAAQEAHAKAQMVLAGIEAAAYPEPSLAPGPELVPEPYPDRLSQPQNAEVVPFASPSHLTPNDGRGRASEAESFAVRWESELPDRRPGSEGLRATRGTNPVDEPSLFEPENEEWFRTVSNPGQAPEIAVIDPARPILGNVIEFPRQLVATRKVRPRLAEGPLATSAAGAQLSIFEVDPEMVSVEPEVDVPQRKTGTAEWNALEPTASEWSAPEWSTMRLAPQPETEYELLEEPEPQPQAARQVELASLSRRLLAAFVDLTVVGGAIVAAAALAPHNATALPGLRAVEIGMIVALVVAAAAYKVLFFTMAHATPGMRYARLALSTFDGGVPTRTQRLMRLAAVALSILPVGLGFAWAIFDDQHLTWHDRISKTYLRVR